MKFMILGSDGTLGSAFVRVLREFSNVEIVSFNRNLIDVTETLKLQSLIQSIEPDFLLNCTGKVGGVRKNLENPFELVTENAKTSISVAQAAQAAKTKNYIYFAPACVYPGELSEPASIEDLWQGVPEQSSLPYAATKLMGIETVRAVRNEFGFPWRVYIPTNLFGFGDWRHKDQGHVISMLALKILDAIDHNIQSISIWGTGNAKRDFLLTDDFSRYVISDLLKGESNVFIKNVPGYGSISIKELAYSLARILNFSGSINFDPSMPEGAKNKKLKAEQLDFDHNFKFNLNEALEFYLKEFKLDNSFL